VANKRRFAVAGTAVLAIMASGIGAPAQSSNNKLPDGNDGIAAQYPGDVGIENDSAVFFAEDFEDISSFGDLRKVFDAVGKQRNVSITTDGDSVNSGKKALAFQVLEEDGEVANRAQKILMEKQDVVFLRFYSKLDKNWEHIRSSHNGGHISGNYFVAGRATAGESAKNRPKFCALIDIFRFDPKAPHPGKLQIYCYYSEQNRGYGDNISPNGMVRGKQKISGPGFVPRPDVIPERGRWYCYELMAKMNTPGKRDGRIACWLDGRIILDFPDMALRDEGWLKIDRIGVGLHVGTRNTPRANIKKYYDDIVAATSYIGPCVTPVTPTED